MKRLIVLLLFVCTPVQAEIFQYTTNFSSNGPTPVLPGWDTTIGHLDYVEYSLTFTTSAVYGSYYPVSSGEFSLRGQALLNDNINAGFSNTITPFSFDTPTNFFLVSGTFHVDTLFTSGLESFYTQDLTLTVLLDAQILDVNPPPIGGRSYYNGTETITYFDAAVVPEPDAITMLGLAMGILMIWYGRRKRLNPLPTKLLHIFYY